MFLGDLVRDHSCLRVRLVGGKVYLICLESKTKATDLLNKIKQMRIAYQRSMGKIYVSKNELERNKTEEMLLNSNNLNELRKINEESTGHGKSISQPYWLLTQAWSSCSLKCGGGTQTLHRLCVLPLGVGECKGYDTVTRPCNIEPCPSIIEIKTKEKLNRVVAKPIVKVLPFSKRYQKYTVSSIII
jgi:hypothetical protein